VSSEPDCGAPIVQWTKKVLIGVLVKEARCLLKVNITGLAEILEEGV
jgi:hypothetical protein